MMDIDLSKLEFCTVVIKNDLQSARDQIVKPILAKTAGLGYCNQDQFAIRLGLEEAIANAFKHGNKCEPNRKICARWAADPNFVVIYVSDDGEGFNPKVVPDPRREENLEKPSGRGLMLMKVYMTELHYNERGNEVCMIKIRKPRNPKASVK
jgi:serine/threonine-protein kinase RsbW